MVDLVTHYCQDSWIRIKTPNQIIKMVLEIWVGIFGAPKKILSDDGLKFQNLQEDGQNDKGRNKISKRRRGCLKKNSNDIECNSKELHENEEWLFRNSVDVREISYSTQLYRRE